MKNPARNTLISTLSSLSGYSKFLEETHERVATFKTFANPTQPVKVLDHFVETNLEHSRSKNINQEELVNLAAKGSKLIISATAGFGKSMLMRYIALCMFENTQGKIPIFVELRHLNRITKPDLLDYIHLTYKQKSEIQMSAFSKALDSGIFCFILDGFDELNHEIRPYIEDQILNTSRLYPKNSFVISGRPDDRFDSWRSFKTYKILPMEKKHVIDLIKKLNHDTGIKRRFISKINQGLYDSHQSFLSTPLLAILIAFNL